MQNIKCKTIDEYISLFPKDIQKLQEEMRYTIRNAAPNAMEAINYGIPTFKLNGNLVHFAAFKNHIGFYPTPAGIEEFEKELSIYKQGKGSVQFPINKPVPLNLISKIVKYRVKGNSLRNFSEKIKILFYEKISLVHAYLT